MQAILCPSDTHAVSQPAATSCPPQHGGRSLWLSLGERCHVSWKHRDLLSPEPISHASTLVCRAALPCSALGHPCALWIREQQVPTALTPAPLELHTSALGPSTLLPDKGNAALGSPLLFQLRLINHPSVTKCLIMCN